MPEPIPYFSEVFRIINGALRLDIVKVRNYVSFLADKLTQAGQTNTAARLRSLLEETDHQLQPAQVDSIRALPVDGETRFSLVEKVDVRALTEPPIVLSQAQADLVSEFVSVCKSQVQFELHGVSTPATLLLYGPPGCGKSRLAREIARELGYGLYMARLDGLISSYLGSTSKNIRSIFEFASRNPCVLLLDEFDALAKLRDDKQELGELKRVVNSFLQNLDTVGSQTVVIAATNHHFLLDSAVWRRFSYSLELRLPNYEQRHSLWHEFLADISLQPRELDILSDLTEQFSGAEIREVCLRLRRQAILSAKTPSLRDAFVALEKISHSSAAKKRFLAGLAGLEGEVVAKKLHRRNPKLYSHSHIGTLLGVSKATAHRWRVRGVKGLRHAK